MPTLNASIPEFEAWVDLSYLGHPGEREKGLVFAISSVEGLALGFHVLLESGAVIGRLPVSAIYSKKEAIHIPHDVLQLWDCFSYDFSVTSYDYLRGMRVETWLKDGRRAFGRYLFTVDWFGNASSERAGHTGWKCGHVLALDSGHFAIQPNNRILWHDSSFGNVQAKPNYKIIETNYKCEGVSRYKTDNQYFYELTKDDSSN